MQTKCATQRGTFKFSYRKTQKRESLIKIVRRAASAPIFASHIFSHEDLLALPEFIVGRLAIYRNLHLSGNFGVVPVLESSCTSCTLRFCASVTPRIYLEIFGSKMMSVVNLAFIMKHMKRVGPFKLVRARNGTPLKSKLLSFATQKLKSWWF